MGELAIACVFSLVLLVIANQELEMFNAATEGNLALVTSALANGTNPNWQNPEQHERTALHQASHNDNAGIVRTLIGAGANPDNQDNQGDTPLADAAYFGSPKVINLLIDNGAGVNIPNTGGRTPLMKAADLGQLSIVYVQALVNGNAYVNLADHDGRTPLHWLSYHKLNKNKLDMARLLLRKGADPNKRDRQGRTPGDFAREKGFSYLANIIENFDINSAQAFATNSTTQPSSTTYSPVRVHDFSLLIKVTVACVVVVSIVIIIYLVVKCHIARRGLAREAQPLQEPQQKPIVSVREAVHFDNTGQDNDVHIYNVADSKRH